MSIQLWFEKYRPSSIKDFIFYNDNLKTEVEKIFASRNIPNLAFSGAPGCGKTTLARILINELVDPSDVLKINASDEKGIDIIRDKIKTFSQTTTFASDYKIVLLEEADYITGDAQACLRAMIEECSGNVRFIFTCNNPDKLHNAILSRVTHIQFSAPPMMDIMNLAIDILESEKIDYEDKVVLQFMKHYPDIRRIINEIQFYSGTGKLVFGQTVNSNHKMIMDCLTSGDWRKLREYLCKTGIAQQDYIDFYEHLYMHIETIPKFKGDVLDNAIIEISDRLYKHATHANSQMNFMAGMISLINM